MTFQFLPYESFLDCNSKTDIGYKICTQMLPSFIELQYYLGVPNLA